MSIKFVDICLRTKTTGVTTAKCKQFSRDSEGLVDAIKSLGTDEITGLINKALRQDALNQLEGKEIEDGD